MGQRKRKKRSGPPPSEDLWTVVYANMMTILMIFFMVMWALQNNMQPSKAYEELVGAIEMAFGGQRDETKIQQAAQSDLEKKVAAELGAIAGGSTDGPLARVKLSREKINVILPVPILFASGSAQLRGESLKLLIELGRKLSELSENEVLVEGHTDDVPIIPGGRYATNWDLSAHRALSTVALLVDAGVKPERITPIGFGEFSPLFPNDSAENRTQNRRLEINILRRNP